MGSDKPGKFWCLLPPLQGEEDPSWLEMGQHRLVQPWVPSQPAPWSIPSHGDAPSGCMERGPGAEGCRERLSLHVFDPGTMCLGNLMASHNRGCTLAL